MTPALEQARIVASLKSGPPLAMSIPITAAGVVAGFLTPVTDQSAQDPNIVDAIFRWRRSHMTAFLTVFTPTLEKARHYLTAFSLPDEARVLFMIANRESRYVGHIGLCNIAPDGAEIDNVIRGERVDVPGFMVCAHKALLGWAFRDLELPLAYLNVLADNTRAIQAYEKVGFHRVGKTSLAREDDDDGYRLRPVSEERSEGKGPVLVRMELLRDSFYRAQSR